MRFSWRSVQLVARREFRATVRRKAYLFTAIGMPAYFAFVSMMSAGPQIAEVERTLKETKSIAVVDSSGAFAHAAQEVRVDLDADLPLFGKQPRSRTFATGFVSYASMEEAEAALRQGRVSQVLLVPADYLRNGRLRRFMLRGSMFSSADLRPVREWLVRSLVGSALPPERAERAVRPTRFMDSYTLNPRTNQFELKDDRREVADFLVPLGFAMLLSIGIVTGGQYLLQGLAEEKESRILESLLCAVSPDELLWGKLLGLGGAGLLLEAFWVGLAVSFGGAALVVLHPDPGLLLFGLFYFLLGYLFYASVMMGVGSVASTLREANQMAFVFTFLNFVPFIMITKILSQPMGTAATVLSMVPLTAPTSMMLRLASPVAIPGWQVALSLALLAATSALVLIASGRVFRIGLLLYGKTPNLPEILRWARQG